MSHRVCRLIFPRNGRGVCAGGLLLIGGLFLLADPGYCESFVAQSPDVATAGGNGFGGMIVADRRRTRILRQAQEMIANEKYLEALNYLQNLIEQEGDQLLRPAADDDSGVFRSLKAEVQRIIGQLPPEGREVYLQNTGPVAEALLKEALEQNDAEKLAQVARLYFHTPAGYEATYRLALMQFDNGEAMAAALLLQRLQRIPQAAKEREPLLSLRIALSWIRAGMPREAETVLEKLHNSQPNKSVLLAGKSRKLFSPDGEPAPWMARMMKSQAAPQFANETDWLMHRLGPTRNVVLPMPEIIESEPWQVATVADPYYKEAEDEIETRLDQELQSVLSVQKNARTQQKQHLLPSRQPLVVGDLVLMRMLESVRAYDLESGDFVFQTFGWDRALETLVGADDKSPVPNATKHLGELIGQRLWDDGTYGRLSSDGERLFCIEDTGFWNQIPDGNQREGIPVSTSNLLFAYELSTGKLVWEAGGPEDDSPERPLSGRYFLGPPMPMAGQLYCLVDVNNEVQLNVLDAETGELVWSQPLASSAGFSIDQDRVRRSSGVSVAYADGVLVCPTDTGATIALDLTTRSLLWGFPSEVNNSFQPQGGKDPFGRGRRPAPSGVALPPGWVDSVPTIHQDKVILTPRKSNKIYLLDLLTGKRIWVRPRGPGLYVAGVANDMVIVVGTRNVQTWNINDDQAGWEKPLRLSEDSTGRAVIVGSELLVPAGDKFLVVDLKLGRETRSIPAPPDVELGNLIVSRGRLISQGVDTLDVIEFPDLKEANDDE